MLRAVTFLSVILVPTAAIGLPVVASLVDAWSRCSGPDRTAETRLIVTDLAGQAYASWSLRELPDEPCPESLRVLLRFSNVPDTRDAWGTPLRMLCRDDRPSELPDGFSFGVMSAGQDGSFGTGDDIRSWMRDRL